MPVAADRAVPMAARPLDRAAAMAMRPVDGASAAVFRIGFGLLGVATVVRSAANGWIAELYVEPAHHFTYSGFWWVQPWPAWGMYLHFALMGLAAAGVAAGYRYRLSIVAFFLLFTYVELIDKTTYLNHYYWVSLVSLLMIFMPLGRTWSLDARRETGGACRTVPAWVIWALRAQLAVVYLFAGIAKLNPDWLLQAQPLRIWLYNSADLWLIGPLLKETWVAYSMSWVSAAFDLTLVAWLLWSRSRPLAYALVIVFHVLTWLLFPIGMFPWLMIFGTLVFFPQDWPARLISRMRTRPAAAPADAPSAGAFRPGLLSRVAVVGLVAFALFQVLVPLRHWAYPGNVRWNEDGYRFSWRVMVTEKTGDVSFRVSDPAGVGEWIVYPDEHLSDLQVERMAYQPDMLAATARIIEEDLRGLGHGDLEVRGDAFVAFNGRMAARFVDPSVDLTSEEPGIWPKRWVLPAPSDP